MTKETYIVISIPSNGLLHTQTAQCLLATLASLKLRAEVFFPLSSAIPFNRNNSVEFAKQKGATHLMFIDADMVFPPDAIHRLLDHKKLIVGTNSSHRQIPVTSTVKFMDQDGNIVNVTPDNTPDELFECFAVGTSFTLIDMKAFDRLERPYFQTIETSGSFEDYLSEDINFCKKSQAAGIKVWCDPTIRIGHIGDYVYEM